MNIQLPSAKRVFLLLFVSTVACIAQERTFLFYKSHQYGSQAQYNPLSMIVNGSFDILQITNRNNNPFKIQYSNGARNVWWNLSRPGSVISQYGWKNFLMTEIFPTSLKIKNAQYWPNYQLHLVGGGVTYIATAEWYEAHGFSYPKTASAATMFVYHFLNEVVENNDYVGPNVDPIADLLIFDPLGIVLFSIPGVPEFFAEKLHAADWSFQPVINLDDRTLINNGQNFTFKIGLPWTDTFRLFYLTGVEGGLGLSYRTADKDHISGCFGYSARELVDVENTTGVRTLTTTLVRTVGFFYDRDDSLLGSLIIGGPRGYKIRVNMYPGILRFGDISPGVSILLRNNRSLVLGLSFAYSPIGLGFPLAQ